MEMLPSSPRQRTIGLVSAGTHPGARTPPGSRHDGAGRGGTSVPSSVVPAVTRPARLRAGCVGPHGRTPSEPRTALVGSFSAPRLDFGGSAQDVSDLAGMAPSMPRKALTGPFFISGQKEVMNKKQGMMNVEVITPTGLAQNRVTPARGYLKSLHFEPGPATLGPLRDLRFLRNSSFLVSCSSFLFSRCSISALRPSSAAALCRSRRCRS